LTLVYTVGTKQYVCNAIDSHLYLNGHESYTLKRRAAGWL